MTWIFILIKCCNKQMNRRRFLSQPIFQISSLFFPSVWNARILQQHFLHSNTSKLEFVPRIVSSFRMNSVRSHHSIIITPNSSFTTFHKLINKLPNQTINNHNPPKNRCSQSSSTHKIISYVISLTYLSSPNPHSYSPTTLCRRWS